MKLWTIQDEQALESLENARVLRATWGHLNAEDRAIYGRSYEWLVERMTALIGPPPVPGILPIWAWQQWKGANRSRPDLRAVRWWHLKGKRCFRIAFACADEKVLLSDYDLWHHVLNYAYLPRSETDDQAFERTFPRIRSWSDWSDEPPDRAYHERVVRSWDRIFDLGHEDPYIGFPRSRRSIQATVWELRLDAVTEITPFIGAKA